MEFNKNLYQDEQTVTIRVTDFYGVNGQHLRPEDCFGEIDGFGDIVASVDNPIRGVGLDQNGLVAKFRVSLLPIETAPKIIEIKNINAVLTSGGGYNFELQCGSLFDSVITFTDSQSASNTFRQKRQQQIGSLDQVFTLKRLSGSNPLPKNEPGFEAPYIINPSISFTIVYYYYKD